MELVSTTEQLDISSIKIELIEVFLFKSVFVCIDETTDWGDDLSEEFSGNNILTTSDDLLVALFFKYFESTSSYVRSKDIECNVEAFDSLDDKYVES